MDITLLDWHRREESPLHRPGATICTYIGGFPMVLCPRGAMWPEVRDVCIHRRPAPEVDQSFRSDLGRYLRVCQFRALWDHSTDRITRFKHRPGRMQGSWRSSSHVMAKSAPYATEISGFTLRLVGRRR